MEFYRYEIEQTGSMGIFPDTKLKLTTFYLIKETPKGYWIGFGNFFEKENPRKYCHWIPKESKKRYAYPTKEEALINFIKRTEKRIKYLERDLYACKTALSRANFVNSK